MPSGLVDFIFCTSSFLLFEELRREDTKETQLIPVTENKRRRFREAHYIFRKRVRATEFIISNDRV